MVSCSTMISSITGLGFMGMNNRMVRTMAWMMVLVAQPGKLRLLKNDAGATAAGLSIATPCLKGGRGASRYGLAKNHRPRVVYVIHPKTADSSGEPPGNSGNST